MKRPGKNKVDPVLARRRRPSKPSVVAAKRGIGSTMEPRIRPKWAWHYRVLMRVRRRLLNDRREQLGHASELLEPHSLDIADSATDQFDHDMALSQLSAEQDALFEIDNALQRIRNGTYGVCEETGKPIPEARLKAIPWTRFDREVEARLERERGVRRPHLGTLGSVRRDATPNWEESEAEEEEPSAPSEGRSRRKAPPKTCAAGARARSLREEDH